MNKKAKIATIIIMIIAILLCSIVSLDNHHLDCCNNDNCPICAMIINSKIITTIAIVVFISLVKGYLVQIFLSKMHESRDILLHNSLVFQNIQLNE